MKIKLTLEKACDSRGASMGRADTLPENRAEAVKLRLTPLRWVGGDYDQGGAYWGNSGGTRIYCAWGDASEVAVRVFVRAADRAEAKELVREKLCNAKFYR